MHQQGFPKSFKGWGIEILLGRDFFTVWREPEEEWIWPFEPFSKLKHVSVNTEHQLKSKLTWPACLKSMKLKQK